MIVVLLTRKMKIINADSLLVYHNRSSNILIVYGDFKCFGCK